MIPRTKVNYYFRDLMKAILIPITSGKYCHRLSDYLTKYLKQKYILLTPSGRGGLYFILKSLKQNKVLIPSYTCKAVAEAASLAGKEVIYIEVEKQGFNISIEALKQQVDADSIVIATHQFGIPCQINEIVEICHACQAIVVEDVAAAIETTVNGRIVGTYGDAAFFSFDSTKLITVPMKAGFICTNQSDLASKIKQHIQQEMVCMPLMHKYKLLILGWILLLIENHLLYRVFHWLMFSIRGKFTAETTELNQARSEFYCYQMADWQAYIALHQLKNIDQLISKRRHDYQEYYHQLNQCKQFTLPPRDESAEWACIRFPICIHGDKIAYYQAALNRGVDFAFSFTFISAPKSFKNATKLANAVLDLPFYYKLSNKERNHVIQVLKELDES